MIRKDIQAKRVKGSVYDFELEYYREKNHCWDGLNPFEEVACNVLFRDEEGEEIYSFLELDSRVRQSIECHEIISKHLEGKGFNIRDLDIIEWVSDLVSFDGYDVVLSIKVTLNSVC